MVGADRCGRRSNGDDADLRQNDGGAALRQNGGGDGRRGASADRGVSTTMDVALGLLFISAAMVLMAAFLQGGLVGHDPESADEAAETISGTTIAIEYDVGDVRSESTFDASAVEDDEAYDRTRHGSVASLVADAAVENTTLWGTRPSATAASLAAAVDGATRSQLVGAETNVRVRAVWRPWQGADARGVVTAGPRPPVEADVSSVTVTMPSGIEVDEPAFQANYSNPDARARLVGDAIVEHHFPVLETRRALQAQGARRQFVVNRYLRFARALGVDHRFDPDADGNPLDRQTANATEANEILATAFADEAMDRGGVGGGFSDYGAAREWLTAGEVAVTVQTWSEG